MGCGLRKEIENMLRLVPGGWRLEMSRYGGVYTYEVRSASDSSGEYGVGVYGKGLTKAKAMAELLANWRSGYGSGRLRECPAQSSEELRLKMCVYAQEK